MVSTNLSSFEDFFCIMAAFGVAQIQMYCMGPAAMQEPTPYNHSRILFSIAF